MGVDEDTRKNIEEQNKRKLEEHLKKLQEHGGKPPPEEKKQEQPNWDQTRQQKFNTDWEAWKRVYGGRVIDLRDRGPKDLNADYQLLGISPKASKDEIRKAFYKLAKENHPDQGGNEARFRELMEAYTRLTGDK